MGSPSAGASLSLGPPDAGQRYVGIQKIVPIVAPVAGADWTQKIEAGTWWRIVALHARFAASAVVANRAIRLEYQDGDSNPIWRADLADVVAANGVRVVSGALGTGAAGALAGGVSSLGLPQLWLPAGFIVKVTTGAIDVGDQWSQLRLLVSEIDRGPLGEAIGRDDDAAY